MRAAVYGKEESVKDFCEKKGYELCASVTGNIGDLPSVCEAEACELCLIADFSCLGDDFFKTVSVLREKGVETVFLCSDGSYTEDVNFVCAFIRDLKKDGLGEKTKKGKGDFRFPTSLFGYERGSDGAVKILPSEGEIIKAIFIMYTSENKGTSKIARMLNEKGVKTKRGSLWTQVAVSRVLSNPIYCGTLKLSDCEESLYREDLKLIEPELFEKARRKLQGAKGTFTASEKREPYALSGLIKCKDCGSAFRRLERKYKNSYVRWVCMGRNMNGADTCPNKTAVDEGELISAIKDYFNQLLSAESSVKRRISSEYNRYHTSDLEGKNRLVGVLNRAFEKFRQVVEGEALTNELLTSVIEKIAVDKNGNVDIYLRLFSEIGVDRHILQGLY